MQNREFLPCCPKVGHRAHWSAQCVSRPNPSRIIESRETLENIHDRVARSRPIMNQGEIEPGDRVANVQKDREDTRTQTAPPQHILPVRTERMSSDWARRETLPRRRFNWAHSPSPRENDQESMRKQRERTAVVGKSPRFCSVSRFARPVSRDVW